MLFMVVETFRNQDGKAVYRKLRDAGRGLPDGLKFVSSYVSADLSRCFQLMEADDVTLFQRWIADWQAWRSSRSCPWSKARRRGPRWSRCCERQHRGLRQRGGRRLLETYERISPETLHRRLAPDPHRTVAPARYRCRQRP
jgi:hypothetical protein